MWVLDSPTLDSFKDVEQFTVAVFGIEFFGLRMQHKNLTLQHVRDVRFNPECGDEDEKPGISFTLLREEMPIAVMWTPAYAWVGKRREDVYSVVRRLAQMMRDQALASLNPIPASSPNVPLLLPPGGIVPHTDKPPSEQLPKTGLTA